MRVGASRFLSKSPPGVSNFKNLRKPSVFSPSPSILIDGEGWGGVALSFRKMRLLIYRAACLRIPLSLVLSPRSAGGGEETSGVKYVHGTEKGGNHPLVKWIKMVSIPPLHLPFATPSPT